MNRGLCKIKKCLPALLITALCIAPAGCGKKPKTVRIGILNGMKYSMPVLDSFREKMAELGYKEGKNVIYDEYNTDFEPEKEKQILEKFVADKVDLIFTCPTEVSILAKNATKNTNIPVVFAYANIEGVDLVDSIQKPNGNLTGVRYPGPDIAAKRLEIMLEIMPDAKCILIPFYKEYPIVKPQMDLLKQLAEKLNIKIIALAAEDINNLKTQLDNIDSKDDSDIDAIIALSEPMFVSQDCFNVIAKFAKQRGIPIAGAIMFSEYGNTIFGINVRADRIGQQVAIIVNKILQGSSPKDIPIISAESFLQINYTAIKENNLNVSEGLLSRANQIIKK